MHCDVEGQDQIAKMVQETLGPAGMLIEEHVEKSGLLPPGKYLKKVLIKGKMVPFLEEEDEDPEEEKDTPANTPTGSRKSEVPVQSPKEEKPKEEKTEHKKKKPMKCSEELSKLTTFSACSFKGYSAQKEKKQWEMCSFSENKVKSLMKKSPKDFIEYNTHHLARIYPKGTRFDSSNYDPVPSWNVGAHMVALNHQTGSEPLWFNHGKFQDNGGCGYILKPEYLIKPDPNYSPAMVRKPAKFLYVNVIGAWQLPKKAGIGKEENTHGSVLRPYVIVKINGVPQDEFTGKTGSVKNNGFNPSFKKEFKIPLTVPELAHILFIVKNDGLTSHDFIAQFSMQVSNIRPGVRMVPLKDAHCLVYEHAALLVSTRLV